MKKLMWILVFVFGFILYWSRSNPEFKAMKQSDASKPPSSASRSPKQERDTLASELRVSIRRHLRETLKDYDSVKNLIFSEPQDFEGLVRMRVSFNSKNSFGAYQKADMLYTFSTNNTFTVTNLIP